MDMDKKSRSYEGFNKMEWGKWKVSDQSLITEQM